MLPLLFFVLLLLRDSGWALLDAAEVEVLRVFASKLGIQWDFKRDPCSWTPIDIQPGSDGPESGIYCGCGDSNNKTCDPQHVRKISVREQNARGDIAVEIKGLQFLDSLDLRDNQITGRIPDAMALLPQMQYISLGKNRLTGSVPTSFGNVTLLNTLTIDDNNLQGSLPIDIGRLKFLTELNVDSSGLTGSIPSEITGLVSLNTLQMGNNNFSGLSFIGNLTTLENLRMNEGSFLGPIPPSLGNLRNLNSLYIMGASNGGPIPESFRNLKNLTSLTLRNCGLSGEIPAWLGNFSGLSFLDLSYNNLSGRIPNFVTPLSTLNVTGNPRLSTSGSRHSRPVAAGVAVGVAAALLLLTTFLICFWRRHRTKRRRAYEGEPSLELLERMPELYTYQQLKSATMNFAPENRLGVGGFGPVYKGALSDGTVVALKQLSAKSSQGTREFLNEVTVISSVQHKNLVKLHGCCIEGRQRILIYEFVENNSLHQALWGKTRLTLDWPTRFRICLGVAQGIAYLHEESQPRIVHRDIKASNILLDKYLNPKIADFGLAKLIKDSDQYVSTQVAGTVGYLAPEYAMRGQLTEKVDIYSYGVLVLEIVSGRRNLNADFGAAHLLEWAWQLQQRNEEMAMVDQSMQCVDAEEALRAIQVALLCGQAVAMSRPPMTTVLSMLIGSLPVDLTALQPEYFSSLGSFIQ